MEYISFVSLILVLFLPVLISLVDYTTVIRSKFIKPSKVVRKITGEPDFTILIPIFGNIKYLKNMTFLKKYSKHVLICATNKESLEFDHELDKVVKEYNFKVFRSNVPLAAKRFSNNTLNLNPLDEGIQFNRDLARDEIIRDCFSIVKTKYSLFLDGDTYFIDDMYALIRKMDEQDLDIASVRVVASKQETMIEKLQSLEYELAMNARWLYPWLTSGAATLGKTEHLRKIMKHHSLYFQGGDIEVGRLAVIMGLKVGHIPFNFYTDVPRTFSAWWKQRQGWFGGGFRHSVVNLHSHGFKYPLFTFYNTFLVFLALPLRWYEVLFHPYILPLVILMYWLLIYAFHWKIRQKYFLIFPLYALFQTLFLVPIGILTYFIMSFRSENVGLIKLRY